MKSINGFIRKERKKRLCTSLPQFWSNLQRAGYWPQRHFSTRSRIATWRLQYIKAKREKSLRNMGLQPEIWLNLTWYTAWSKWKCGRKLGLAWNIISEHLFQLSPALSVSVFWYCCSSLSDFRHSWRSSRQMLAGELGERPLGRKSTCCVCCAWRGNPGGVRIMWREVGKGGQGPYAEEPDKKWNSQIRHGMWNKTPKR